MCFSYQHLSVLYQESAGARRATDAALEALFTLGTTSSYGMSLMAPSTKLT